MEHQHLMELAVTAAPCGIAVIDEAGTILFANSALHAMCGYGEGALQGLAFAALVPGAWHGRAATNGQPAAHATAWVTRDSRSTSARKLDGSAFHVEIGLSPTICDDVPVMIATVVDPAERDDLKSELSTRHEFERTLAEIAAGFLASSDDDFDTHLSASQRQLAGLLGVERSTLWQPDGTGDLKYSHVWLEDPTIDLPSPEALSATACFPWSVARMREGQMAAFASIEELPDPIDRASHVRIGTRSGIFVPLMSGGQLLGALTFATLTSERSWSGYALGRLRLIGTVFASALARRATDAALQSAHGEVKQLRDQLAAENVQLRKEVRTLKRPRVLASQSAAAQQALRQIEQVAPTTASVLLLGETGAGKEVFAEALHELSPRRQRRMVRVNCAAIPAALIESELFGRERGAYTGAISRQVGRFELADNSTIFLDEIGDLPLDVQVKLLRVLQDHVIERLGSPQQIKVNVRVIAATNRDLEQAVADRTFREDLFYRLNVFPIRVPALRERVEDIPTLVWSFVDEFAAAFGKSIDSVSKASMQALQAYPWPGNVRELRNVVERAVIVANGPQLVIDTPRPMLLPTRRKSVRFVDVEIEHLRSVLESTGWRIRGSGGAADLLGIKPTTLESRMAKLGIVRSGKPMGTPVPGRTPAPSAPQRHGHGA